MNQFTQERSQELLVIRPQTVTEGMSAVLAVRSQKTVVLDLSAMDRAQAQRTADFVSGGVSAVDGEEHRLGEHVFLMTPAGVQVTLN
ncbi:Cell division protein SepF [Synechococcus sp. MIT S9509]|uniref:cell division protein SepF n=1 Tax=Synechococcus sp. MIT S9509 TaxID=1801630 RepID=UPI0007BB4F26|nr:cell division protein SepF [Synechococcus sp. MIT S9509]KZR92599.1 Cell division protein SepF [Synechococcus sp. MIT S9509]